MERLAEFVIVPAGPGDAAALADVHVRAWRETYRGLLPELYLERMSAAQHALRWRRQLTRARPGDVVLAAESPRGVVGYCAGAIVGGTEAEVFTLYLLRAAQGCGLGRRLLEMTSRALAAQGARSLRLWVLSGNEKAMGFYAHLGGVPVNERPSPGWSGALRETAFRWSDIRALAAAG
ncbi:MAG TPA: GNAT family N-acetyltransferase [Caulobacteraceae bacterium]|jgi:ribosomal protein S18 acetylase RimI-like enzyme